MCGVGGMVAWVVGWHPAGNLAGLEVRVSVRLAGWRLVGQQELKAAAGIRGAAFAAIISHPDACPPASQPAHS